MRARIVFVAALLASAASPALAQQVSLSCTNGVSAEGLSYPGFTLVINLSEKWMRLHNELDYVPGRFPITTSDVAITFTTRNKAGGVYSYRLDRISGDLAMFGNGTSWRYNCQKAGGVL